MVYVLLRSRIASEGSITVYDAIKSWLKATFIKTIRQIGGLLTFGASLETELSNRQRDKTIFLGR